VSAIASRHRSPLGWLADHPWFVVLAAFVVAFAWWAMGTRNQPHHVRALFPSAFNLVSGQAVSVDGLEVGKIGTVAYHDGKALVTIGIKDERFWPLHAGTKVVSRWGTTIGSGTRRLDLVPGPAVNPALREDGIIPTADTQAAVDVDQVLNVMNGRVRGYVRGTLRSMHAALGGRERQLSDALRSTPAGLEGTGDVMNDLASDTVALRSLITGTHRLTYTLASRGPAIRDLVTVGAQTFQTFALNTQGTQASLEELAPTLRQTRSTLTRVDTSVNNLDALMTALRPGAQRLAPLAAQARPALAELRRILPSATATVEDATNAAPQISALLAAAQPSMKIAPGVFDALSPMIACVRPYAPEAGGALVGGGGAHQNYDLMDPKLNPTVFYSGRAQPDGKIQQHSLRAMPMVSASTPEKPLDSQQFAAASGKLYAYPRPPGLTTGQPWFQPECGVTKDALDPSKDPERP
jgi:ABC-type transporter Mla subunit MlaD